MATRMKVTRKALDGQVTMVMMCMIVTMMLLLPYTQMYAKEDAYDR